MKIRYLTALVITLFLLGCGQAYLRTDSHYENEVGFSIDEEAKIADNTENRKVIDVLMQYRRAMIRKDVGTLRRLVSERYYDNAATTDTTRDDYSAEQLPELFEMFVQSTEQIKYDVKVKRVQVTDRNAYVDYEFKYAYRYKVGESPTWDAGLDVNRLQLESENGEWKIVSGL